MAAEKDQHNKSSKNTTKRESKGLMARRKSFSQKSVPNAKKGTDQKSQFVMLGVFAIFILASYILAKLSV